MVEVWYATREAVRTTLDSVESTRNNRRIDRAIAQASRSIEGQCHRLFHPTTATRYFDWPDRSRNGRAWRLWLDEDEIISLSSLTSGGTALSASDYFLEPVNQGPPYTYVEINLANNAAFTGAASTWQHSLVAVGDFGYGSSTEAAGTLSGAVSSTTATTVAVSDSGAIGVGDFFLVDSERMRVTAKAQLTTGQTLQTPLTASNSNVTVAVTTGSAYHVDETILLDSEKMLITDISGNNLTVERAYEGSVLATHTGSTIYAPRTLTVVRGYLGSTAATHADTTACYRHVPPSLITEWCIGEALTTLAAGTASYARVAVQGENIKEITGKALTDIRQRAIAAYARKVRMKSV